MIPHPEDTIVALSSVPGGGGRAVVRLSGMTSLRCALTAFSSPEPILPGKRRFYGGQEPATTKPVSEGVQAAYYRAALELAACQPTVRGFLIFHVTDETDYNRWQSGVYYADGTPKSTRAVVEQTIDRIHDSAVDCETVAPEDDSRTLVSNAPPSETKSKPGKKSRPLDASSLWTLLSAS